MLDCSYPPKNGFRYIYGFLKFLKYQRQSDAIIVGFFGHLIVPVARLFSKKPIIFDSFVSVYQTMVMDRQVFKPEGLLSWLTKFLDQKSSQIADHVFCDTEQNIRYYCDQGKGDPKKFSRLWVGTDDSVFYPREPQMSGKKFLVHFHGELQPLHGVDTIIAAAQLLPDVQFRIVGKNPQLSRLAAQAKEQKIFNIEFIPPVPYERLPDLLNEADVCLGIFGTTIKARSVIPHKVFEAMAMAKPLITADTQGVRELLEHRVSCLLIPPGNAQALADAIMILKADSSLRYTLGHNAYQIFKEQCRPAVLGKHIIHVMETFKS
ncbi:MAG: glycosyltransferase family 4 protein [Candidatus Omnitrophica bacterium]|nr:glycosyltransferase family 4 protein [Candidatus Omnitrophota bacterium]